MKTKIVTIIFTLYLFFGLSYSAYSGEKNGNNKNSAFFLSDEKANKVYQRNMLADLLTKIIFYKWDKTWIFESQELYSYDALNREIESKTQIYESNQWVNKERSLYYYSTGIQPIEMVNQEYKNNKWVNVSRTLLSYNSQNNTTESLSQDWNDTGWVNKTKVTYNYSSNNITDVITQKWSGAWVNQSKVSYTYNSSNRVSMMTMYEWKNNDWQYSIRYLMAYDSQGNNYLEEIQNYQSGTWFTLMKTTRTYNSKNQLTESVTQMNQGLTWMNMYKTTYTYDSYGNITQTTQYDGMTGSWVPTSRTTTTYNKLNQELVRIYESYSNGNWQNSSKAEYFYGAGANFVYKDTQIPDKFELSQNYPNPFNPSTKIKFYIPEKSHAKLTIYNLLGEKIITLLDNDLSVGEYELNFEAKNLPSGVYFYRLETPKQTITKKMILSK
ncbi:MAG TPA: T9SS type A sorting domain-containing protein [Ignavibacteria bacterium]